MENGCHAHQVYQAIARILWSQDDGSMARGRSEQ